MKAFLTHLQITGYFIANGICYDLKNQKKSVNGETQSLKQKELFQIGFQELRWADDLQEYKSEKLQSIQKHFEKHKLFILNNDNYRSFFSQISVEKDGKASNQPGWLKDCKEGDVIVFENDLTEGQRQRVLYTCNKAKKSLIFRENDPVTGLLNPSWTFLEEKGYHEPGAYLLQSSDPDFSVSHLNKLLRQQKCFVNHVVPIHNNIRFTDIMASLSVSNLQDVKDLKNYEFNCKLKYTQTSLLNALLCGETVILHGAMNMDFFEELASLRAIPPYLQLNGRRVEIPGRLFIITPPLNYKVKGVNRHEPTWIDYEKALQVEFSDFKQIPGTMSSHQAISCLAILYQFAQGLDYGKAGMPDELLWNYTRLSDCVKLLLTTDFSKGSHPENILKSKLLFDYDPFSEEYAFLNVMMKMLFGHEVEPTFRPEKRVKSKIKWLQWNSHNGAALRQITSFSREQLIENPQLLCTVLKDQKNSLPEFTPKVDTDALFYYILSFGRKVKVEKPNKHFTKLVASLKTSPFYFAKGLPGTGKSYTSEILESGDHGLGKVLTFWSEDQIGPWSEAKEGDYIILFIDEANLNNPEDYWNFLKGLRDTPPNIYWKGRYILLTPKHKVVFTGNPEHYSRQRDFHSFLQEAHIDFYKSWPEEKSVAHLEKVWRNLNAGTTEEKSLPITETMRRIVKSMRTLEEFNSTLFPPGRLSLRDLHQVLHRLSLRSEIKTDLQQLAYSVCRDEWIPLLPDVLQRNAFKKILKENFQILDQDETELNRNISEKNQEIEDIKNSLHIPESRWHDVFVIYEDLKMQLQPSSKVNSHRNKSAILLEGPSGIGKTTLLCGLLQNFGYKKITPDELTQAYKDSNENKIAITNKNFIHLTAGDEHNAELLLQAFMLGIPVVYDEINLEPLSELLNHLLTGVTPDRIKPYRPGFFLMASQNSGLEKLPLDFENRFRKIYLHSYSDIELIEIAEQALNKASIKFQKSDLERFVKGYDRARKLRNGKINSRNFFRTLKNVIQVAQQKKLNFVNAWKSSKKAEENLEIKDSIIFKSKTGPHFYQSNVKSLDYKIAYPVTSFLQELMEMKGSSDEIKKAITKLKKEYFFKEQKNTLSFFTRSNASENHIIDTIFIIALLNLNYTHNPQRSIILKRAAQIASKMPNADELIPAILKDENKLLIYLGKAYKKWPVGQAWEWLSGQGWDKEFVAVTPPEKISLMSMVRVASDMNRTARQF